MEIFIMSFTFPKEEKYSLTDQIRRSSRSVSANISESWGKRRYVKSFISKLTDSEGEARETQTWLEYAFACNYIEEKEFIELNEKYNQIIGMIVNIIMNAESWCSFNPNPNNPNQE